MNDRPKFLSPTLRPKNRYMAYQVIAEKKILFADLANAMWHSMLNLLGESGTGKTNIWILKSAWDENNQTGLIKCDHTAVEHVRASLALIQRIGDNPVIVKVLGISGTIKSAKKKFFGERDLTYYA